MPTTRVLLFFVFYSLFLCASAQINEDFSDGNFTANPAWTGETALFQVTGANLELQSNGPSATDTLYLSTSNPTTSLVDQEWEILVRLEFQPSTGNKMRIYLASDQSNLEGNLNGYYLEVGATGSPDPLELWRQDGATTTLVGTGVNNCFGSTSNNTVRIRVSRDNSGNWTVESDCSGGSTFTQEGIFTDATYSTTAHFGVWCRHTSTRNDLFFFDDIYVGPVRVDTTKPTLVSATAISATELDVLFSEPVDLATCQTTTNYSVGGIGNPASAVRDAGNQALVHLTFGSSFPNGVQQTLTVNNVEDQAANAIVAGSTINFTWFMPVTASYKDVLINEVMHDPTPVVGLPSEDYIELYNRSSNPMNLQNWILSDAVADDPIVPSFVLQPGAYVIVCDDADTALFSPFGDVVWCTTLPAYNATGDAVGLRDDNGTLIDTVQVDDLLYLDPGEADGGWSLELVNPLDTCSRFGNWVDSDDPSGGTPGRVNSVYNPVVDVTPPALSSVVVNNDSVLVVCFDESLDSALAANPSSYNINGLGNPIQVIVGGAGLTCVTLTFSPAMQTGNTYVLEILQAADCKGNAISSPLTDTLIIPDVALPYEVRINEIMADPSPVVGLPESEYLELYNTSATKSFDLGGWTISSGGTPQSLPNFTLAPQSYVILCDTADESNYTQFGDVVSIPAFPSLSNTADELGLRNANFVLIDSVEYTLASYQDGSKDDGGWSLELINPLDSCNRYFPWIASNDSSGGTPGRENSVFNPSPDNTPPVPQSASPFNGNRLTVCFDESLDPASATNLSNYLVVGFAVPDSAFLIGPENHCVELVFAGAFVSGNIYELVVENVADCKGNAQSSDTLVFGVGANAAPFEVILNEVHPDVGDPIGLPEREYVELFNNTNKVISLSNWTLEDGSGSDGDFPGGQVIQPGEYLLLTGTGGAADYPGIDVVELSGFPSLNNTADTLYLKNESGDVMDYMYYPLTLETLVVEAEDGRSLERVDPGFTCINVANWKVSTAQTGGTPALVNSVSGTTIDSTAPRLLSASYSSLTSFLILSFDEALDPALAEDPNNYTITPSLGTVIGAVLGRYADSRVYLLLSQQPDTNVIYTVRANNLTDCPGNLIGAQDSALFGIPLPPDSGDVILNEILFNQPSGGVDYVELYNQSENLIDIGTLIIGRRDPETGEIDQAELMPLNEFILLPHSYVALTEDRAFTISHYNPIDPDAVFEVSNIPTYSDNEGICVIMKDDADSTVLDEFHYLDDYQFPNLDDDDGVSLERLNFSSETQNPDNWHSAASTVNYGTPGYKNSEMNDPNPDPGTVEVDPEIFSPDQDGFEDILTINYDFDEPGWNARVTIFDDKGRQVRRLRENFLVGTDAGFLTWDGIDDYGKKVPVGVYVILFETSNPNNGKVKVFKVGCVVAADLN